MVVSRYRWSLETDTVLLGLTECLSCSFVFVSTQMWNETLCKMDSDMDGKSNGEELGDPECKWKPGTQPDRLPIGHPGT